MNSYLYQYYLYKKLDVFVKVNVFIGAFRLLRRLSQHIYGPSIESAIKWS